MQTITLTALAMIAAVAPVQSQAAVELDQLSAPPALGYKTIYIAGIGYLDPIFTPPEYAGARVSVVQTVTSGIAGVLDHISFSGWQMFGQSVLRLSLIDGDYATGANSIIGSQIIDFNTFPGMDLPNSLNSIFDTSAFQYHVSAGQRFSILFDTPPDTFGMIALGIGYADVDLSANLLLQKYVSEYAGGELVYALNGVPDFTYQGDDLSFATYVDTGAVPEPATWAMMVAGFAMAGFALRRRASEVRRTGVTFA